MFCAGGASATDRAENGFSECDALCTKKPTTLPLPIEVEEKQALPPFRRFLPIFIPPPLLFFLPQHTPGNRREGEHSFHIRASFPFSILALPRIEIAHLRKLFLGVRLICLSTKEQKSKLTYSPPIQHLPKRHRSARYIFCKHFPLPPSFLYR